MYKLEKKNLVFQFVCLFFYLFFIHFYRDCITIIFIENMFSLKVKLIYTAREYEKQMGIFYRAWNALECVVGDSLLGHILFGVIIITLRFLNFALYFVM